MMKKIFLLIFSLIILSAAFVGGMFAYRSSATIRSWFETSNSEQQKEITDFYFYKNQVARYKGNSNIIDNIPTSYSKVDKLSYTKHFETSSEYEESQMTAENLVEYICSPIDIIPDDNTIELIHFDGGLVELSEWLSEEEGRDINDYFPAKINFYETTFYEGNDYQVEEIGEMFFLKDYLAEEYYQIEKIVLPETINNIYYSVFDSESLKEIVITNENQILKVDDFKDYKLVPIDSKVYVPDNLYEEYKASEIFKCYDGENLVSFNNICKISELKNF